MTATCTACSRDAVGDTPARTAAEAPCNTRQALLPSMCAIELLALAHACEDFTVLHSFIHSLNKHSVELPLCARHDGCLWIQRGGRPTEASACSGTALCRSLSKLQCPGHGRSRGDRPHGPLSLPSACGEATRKQFLASVALRYRTVHGAPRARLQHRGCSSATGSPPTPCPRAPVIWPCSFQRLPGSSCGDRVQRADTLAFLAFAGCLTSKLSASTQNTLLLTGRICWPVRHALTKLSF